MDKPPPNRPVDRAARSGGARHDPRPPARSPRKAWLLAGAISVIAHLAVMGPALLARGGPPPVRPVEAAPPVVVVTLFRPPPPTPGTEPAPAAGPGPPAGPATVTPAASPARARPAPPAPTPRPGRPSSPAPPEVATLAVRAAAPPALLATLSDAQLAGATVAGAGGGEGGFGAGGGSGGGSGAGDGGCDMVGRLQDALRNDPEVRAAVARAQSAVGPGKALLVWNGEWIRNPGEAGEGLAGVRQAIAMEVAFAPHACRARPMRGLVLISFSDASGGPRLALGKGSWGWGDMLGGR